MKLHRVEKKSEQDYPLFDEYWKNRRKYLTEAALCAGIILGTGMLTSCGQKDVRISGDMVAPQPPTSQPNATPPTTGENPEKPVTIEPDVPQVEGKMVEPKPPTKPENVTPRIRGKMIAPKSPEVKTPVTPIKPEAMIDGGMAFPVPPPKAVDTPVEEK